MITTGCNQTACFAIAQLDEFTLLRGLTFLRGLENSTEKYDGLITYINKEVGDTSGNRFSSLLSSPHLKMEDGQSIKPVPMNQFHSEVELIRKSCFLIKIYNLQS